jgi:hypothetical protein
MTDKKNYPNLSVHWKLNKILILNFLHTSLNCSNLLVFIINIITTFLGKTNLSLANIEIFSIAFCTSIFLRHLYFFVVVWFFRHVRSAGV